ncbi:MAG: hypothetical protein IT391_11660 [Nitrospira sp.]|nr:hypothetical protein [Nitrospira sp.]
MTHRHSMWARCCTTISLVLTVGVAMNAEAGFLGLGGDSWKEEVLLHDGRKVVITRSQTYGGSREIGQPPPIKEHTITFTLPNTDKAIEWTSEYGEDIGRTNFFLLAVHVLSGKPYIVAEPYMCLSYNKWGRPNPPYVVFKYEGTAWQRIPLAELPAEFTTINVALAVMGREVKHLVELGFVSSETIKKLNDHIDRREVKTLLREPVKAGSPGSTNCEERVLYKGQWILPNDPIAREFIDRQKK